MFFLAPKTQNELTMAPSRYFFFLMEVIKDHSFAMQIVRCTRKSSLMIFKFLISVTIMKKETFFPLAGASRRSTGRQPVERGALECARWSSPAGH